MRPGKLSPPAGISRRSLLRPPSHFDASTSPAPQACPLARPRDNGVQRPDQRRARPAKLLEALPREFGQNTVPTRREVDENVSLVLLSPHAPHQPALCQAIDQLDRAVMAHLQALGQVADGGLLLVRQAAQHEQQEILLGLQAGCPGAPFGKIQEPADLIAKLGERLVIGQANRVTHPPSILSYTDRKIKRRRVLVNTGRERVRGNGGRQALGRSPARNLRCTAALVNSRSASEATQRAALESIARIWFAVRMAKRFSRALRLPICRNAQFTAFLTMWRSSAAWRRIIASSRANLASGARLSCTAR